LTIKSGDTVIFETGLGGGRRYSPTSTPEDVLKKSPCPPGLELTGPVFVVGAEPGDALEIEILDVVIDSWGYTAIEPGFGLLPEDFPNPAFRSWDLSNGRMLRFNDTIEIPLRPFLGVIGVAPPPPKEYDSIPPRIWGGNIDIRQLTAGARLWLPVAVDGALLSAGDAHGAQGDGEVCGTAVETTARASLRISLRSGFGISAPQFRTPPFSGADGAAGWHCTTGVGPDLMQATKDAVRGMIKFLRTSWKLSDEDAYILCSLAVDLKINEIVDKPNWIVSACLPLSIRRQ
jgi:acetamidase/formamidase